MIIFGMFYKRKSILIKDTIYRQRAREREREIDS